jgi:hypothetical protein
MEKVKLSTLATLMVVLLFVIAACTPSRIPVDEYDGPLPGGTPIEQEPEPTVVVREIDVPESNEEPTPEVELEGGIPEDLPLMEGAYQIQAGHAGKNVSYQIDGTIEDVLTFYQEELPKFGWELSGPPDNAIGSIGTMLRENVAGDRLTINMQSNEVGGFVKLTIVISRGGF